MSKLSGTLSGKIKKEVENESINEKNDKNEITTAPYKRKPVSKNYTKKEKEALERCYFLYENSKIQKELQKIMKQKNDEIQLKHELMNCTFKPKLNREKTNTNQRTVKQQGTIYERTLVYKKQSEKKIEKLKQEIEKREYKNFCTNPNWNELFNPCKNIINDFSAKVYVERQEKSRNKKFKLEGYKEYRNYDNYTSKLIQSDAFKEELSKGFLTSTNFSYNLNPQQKHAHCNSRRKIEETTGRDVEVVGGNKNITRSSNKISSLSSTLLKVRNSSYGNVNVNVNMKVDVSQVRESLHRELHSTNALPRFNDEI